MGGDPVVGRKARDGFLTIYRLLRDEAGFDAETHPRLPRARDAPQHRARAAHARRIPDRRRSPRARSSPRSARSCRWCSTWPPSKPRAGPAWSGPTREPDRRRAGADARTERHPARRQAGGLDQPRRGRTHAGAWPARARSGHAGTLDPMATGLLILGLQSSTRLLTYIVGTDKEYHATIRLGASTTTDDAEGELVSEAGSAETRRRRTGCRARRDRRPHRRDRAGPELGERDQGRRQAGVRPCARRRGGGAGGAPGHGVGVRAPRLRAGRRRRRDRRDRPGGTRRVLVRNVHPVARARPGRDPRRRRTPDPAAAHARRSVRGRRMRTPSTTSTSRRASSRPPTPLPCSSSVST